ncbi:MAG: hypothetical protein KGJ02_01590 [Verrucomicrobiota bacterium]|nr:hypothetical protein [Verrucomicrobiota bacterium]
MSVIWNTCSNAVQWARATEREVGKPLIKVALVASAFFLTAPTLLTSYKSDLGPLPGFAAGAFLSVALDVQMFFLIRLRVTTLRGERNAALRQQLQTQRAAHFSGLLYPSEAA